MIISMNGSQSQNLATLKQELSRTPGVLQTSTAEYLPGNGSFIDEHRIERSNGEMRSATIARIFIDKDYLKLLGLKIVHGRDFDPENDADYKNSFLVNEATVKAYGWDKTPNGAIGKKIDGFNYGKQGVVVGVVKDANLFSLKQKIEPLIFNMTSQAGNMYIKVDGVNMPANVSAIEVAYKKIFQTIRSSFNFLTNNTTSCTIQIDE